MKNKNGISGLLFWDYREKIHEKYGREEAAKEMQEEESENELERMISHFTNTRTGGIFHAF